MDKKKLFIVSASFPYGSQEVFLENELVILSNYFDIQIAPLYNNHSDRTRELPYHVNLFPTIIPKNKFKQALRLILSNQGLFMELKEIFKLIRMNKFNAKNIKSLLIAIREYRSFRSSEAYKYLQDDKTVETVYFYWCSSVVLSSRNINKNSYIRVHGGELNESYYGYIPFLEQKTNLNANYLPISEDCKNRLKELNPLIHSKVLRLGTFNSLELKYRKFNNDLFRIVSCSSLIPVKRVDLITEILKYCHRKIEWIHFGDGLEYEKIIHFAQTNLPFNVTFKFMGRVNNSSILNYYSQNEISMFINVSESEGVPVSIMEAMSYGIPCIATNVGGISEIVNNDNGFLIEKDFIPKKIAKIIDSLTEDELIKYSVNAFNNWNQYYNAFNNYQDLVKYLNKSLL